MLGEWFYNQRIRKATAVFGTLFNNIYVVRKNSAGETISQIKVPLSYAPKRDFVDRIAKMESGENQERQISVKLPRMSFEINAFTYDATRQLPKINKRTIPSTEGASTAQKLYTPVPYTLSFQLHIYGRNQDDCLQIVEQILPYFTPQYNVSIKPLEGFDLQEDTPIKLESVTFSDDFEAALENRRTIIYTLDFDMKITLYKGVPTASGTILDATANFYNYGTTDLLTSIQCLANQVTGNSSSITEDQGPATGTLKVTNTLNALYDSDQNVIGNPFSIESGDSADFGTAIVNSATGEWTYTPNGDFYGTDTFKIGVDVGQGVTEKFTVTVNITSDDDDAITSNFTVFRNIPTIVDVSTNDTFETLNDVTYTIQTLPSSGGNLSIQDGSAGTFLYTAQSAVSPDFFEYRGLPEGGTAEVGEANVTILDALTYSVSVPNAIEGETINATITTNVANNQTLSWTITGDNTTNGRISTASGTVVMDATTKQIPIVIDQPAGEQGTVQSTFTITDNSPQYPNTSYGTPPTASDTFDILDTYPAATYQAPTPTNNGDFSYQIASNSDYLVIGEPGTESAYLRTISDGTTVELTGATGETGFFGRTVAISDDGNLIAVGAMNSGTAAARVHLFDNTGTYLGGITGPTGDRWGTQVAITDNYLLVSEPRGDAVGNNSGQIYVYSRTSPFTQLDTFDYDLSIPNGDHVGLTLATSPSNTDQFVAGGHASPVRLGKIVSDAQQYTNFLDMHDNTASIWNSHYDASNNFTNGPTSLAMSNNHVFIGVPKLNRVAVWRYADPLNGNFGTLGATPTTPLIDGSFAVSNSGRRIDLGAQAPDLISGRTDPQNMAVGEFSGTIQRSGTSTWNGANGGIAWIRNKDTDEYIICRLARDMAASGFPAVPQYPTQVFTRSVQWTTTGNEPGSNPAIPGYTTDGTYNLQISMIAQYSHRITLTGQSGETDIDFGWQVAVSPDSTELYVAAPSESWSGENRGTIYRFALDDTVDVGFDRTLAADTIATLNGYLRGEVGDYLGSNPGASTYFWGGGAQGQDYGDGAPKQIITNGTFVHVSNNKFTNNQGRVLENQSFTSI